MKNIIAALILALGLGIGGQGYALAHDASNQKMNHNKVIFNILTQVTPHCKKNSVTNCHYSDSVSFYMKKQKATIFAEVHSGKYSVTIYPN